VDQVTAKSPSDASIHLPGAKCVNAPTNPTQEPDD
jgi:hypothetical protein